MLYRRKLVDTAHKGEDASMDVELLVVADCPSEQPANELLGRALQEAGRTGVPIRTVVVGTAEEAELLNFSGSPTILIDGVDPFLSPARSCGLSCRIYPQLPGSPELLDLAVLTAAITRASLRA